MKIRAGLITRRFLPIALAVGLLGGTVFAQTLKVGVRAGLTTLDPAQGANVIDSRLNQNLHDYLTRLTGDGQVVPALAANWHVSDDGLVWTFTLRDDAVFHNGEPVNAEAVKFSFERMMAPGFPTQSRSLYEMVEDVKVISDYVVEFKLSHPNAVLLNNLSTSLAILPPAYVAEAGEAFARQPIGAGPFQFVSWLPGQSLTLKRFEDYYQGPAAYEAVMFRFIPDDVSRVNALLSGDVDIAGPLADEHARQVEQGSNTHLSTASTVERRQIILDTTRAPFDDVRVRQAVNYAIDVEAIIDFVLGGYGQVTATAVVPVEYGYAADIKPYPYDPERAVELLTEAGYADGLEVTFYVPIGRYLKGELVAEAIGEYLKDVGITANLRLMEYSTFVQMATEGQLSPMFMLGWQGGGVYHLENVFRLVFGCQDFSPPWGPWYCNPDLDDVVNAGLEADGRGNSEEALAAYREAQEIIREEAPWIYLYAAESIYGVSDSVDWRLGSGEALWMYEAKPATN